MIPFGPYDLDPARARVDWSPGREVDVLMVARPAGPPVVPPGASVSALHEDLPGWWVVRSEEAEALGGALLRDRQVRTAYLAFAPPPPPVDRAPETPDFTPLQAWVDGPGSVRLGAAWAWPGGDAGEVRLADVEYGWDAGHEDLERIPVEPAWGQRTDTYLFHGNSVFGMLAATPNAYGVSGVTVGAELLGVSPFTDDGVYSVAAAVAAAAALLAPGDVLLIEQQAYANATYCPVSVDPATWDAIRAAVDAGIVVVEPGGNGGADLDGPEWSGWFDRAHDSGSILVGGGASPSGGYEPLAWYPNGSSYGARVDVQGWFDGIVTTSGGDYPAFSDLFLPDGDLLQGYTASFGGTSGASPMVAAAAALLQSIAIRTGAGPYAPEELRALLRSTGTPQRGGARIGPQPDLRRLLRTVALP